MLDIEEVIEEYEKHHNSYKVDHNFLRLMLEEGKDYAGDECLVFKGKCFHRMEELVGALIRHVKNNTTIPKGHMNGKTHKTPIYGNRG